MERELRCDRCNTLNSPGVTYCVKCGRLLPSISTNLQHRPTVWELEQVPDDSGTVSQNRNKRPDSEQHARYIVKCPQCGTVIETHGGVLPMTCNDCGYFFQNGVDKVVPQTTGKDNNTGNQNVPTEGRDGNNRSTRNPMPRARIDSSHLRLIPLNLPGAAPEWVKPEGAVIGSTALKQLKSKCQIKVWHAASGWYISPLIGKMRIDADNINTGTERQLKDGNMLFFNDIIIRCEITQ